MRICIQKYWVQVNTALAPSLVTKVCSTLGKWSYSPIIGEEAEIPEADIPLYNVSSCPT